MIKFLNKNHKFNNCFLGLDGITLSFVTVNFQLRNVLYVPGRNKKT